MRIVGIAIAVIVATVVGMNLNHMFAQITEIIEGLLPSGL